MRMEMLQEKERKKQRDSNPQTRVMNTIFIGVKSINILFFIEGTIIFIWWSSDQVSFLDDVGPFSFFLRLLLFFLFFTLQGGANLVPSPSQPYTILYFLLVLLGDIPAQNPRRFPQDRSASKSRSEILRLSAPLPFPAASNPARSRLLPSSRNLPSTIPKPSIRWRNDRPDVDAWVLICASSGSAIILPAHVLLARASNGPRPTVASSNTPPSRPWRAARRVSESPWQLAQVHRASLSISPSSCPFARHEWFGRSSVVQEYLHRGTRRPR